MQSREEAIRQFTRLFILITWLQNSEYKMSTLFADAACKQIALSHHNQQLNPKVKNASNAAACVAETDFIVNKIAQIFSFYLQIVDIAAAFGWAKCSVIVFIENVNFCSHNKCISSLSKM